MLKNYFKIAFRRLRADHVHTAINVLGLALGITSCLVIYIFIRYELSFDSFHSNSENTYRVVEHSLKADGVQHWPTTAYPLAEAIRRDLPGVQVTQTAGPLARVISSEDSKGTVHRFEENRLMFADQNYLRTFDFMKAVPGGIWLAGNEKTAFDQPNAVVLTQKLADRYFAENAGNYEKIIGRTLMLNNTDPIVVSGVISNPPHNTNLLFEMLVNYAFFKTNNQYQANNWSGNYQGTTYVTLAPGADTRAFEKQLAGLKTKYMNAEDNRRISYFLQPLADIHTNTLYEDFLGGYHVSRQMLLVLGSLAVFLILIASFNFINLTTAQASRRNKEVGVRKVVGSTQRQLFVQLIGETLIIAFIAGLISAVGLEFFINGPQQFAEHYQSGSPYRFYSLVFCGRVGSGRGFAGGFLSCYGDSTVSADQGIEKHRQYRATAVFTAERAYYRTILHYLWPAGRHFCSFPSDGFFYEQRSRFYPGCGRYS